VKTVFSALALLTLSLPLAAQTAVTPTIANNQVSVTVQDSNGGTHVIGFPVTATTTLSVGPGTDTYTGPAVVVAPPPPPVPVNAAPTIPKNAISVDLINPKTAWKNTKDAGTPGTATFSNNYPVSGIFANDARAFSIAYTGAGGVRFSNSFAKDTTATHYVYDTVVLSPDWTHTANLELDLNVVRANGKTSILGTQCSSYSKTWEVTFLTSTGKWHWVPTNVACSPLTWTPNVPHRIRIFGTITLAGTSTYTGVELDGAYKAFTGTTGNTADALGWSVGGLITNFQIDGKGTSGSAIIYSNKLTMIRW
jgi:hypothetical protein